MCQKLMMLNKLQLLKNLFVCAGVMVATSASAGIPEESSAPVIHLGGVSAYPGFSVIEKSNNNLFRSDVNKQSSLITVVSPSLDLNATRGANVYSLTYRADVARYAQSSADNYTDQSVFGAALMTFSSRSLVDFKPEFRAGHDDRGSTFGPGTADPNTWKNAGFSGAYTYGSKESIAKFVMDVSYNEVNYQNNRALTAGYDKTLKYLAGSFNLRMSPKTLAFVKLDNLDIGYKDPTSPFSGKEQHLLLGLTWKATAQTNGTFKIGQLQKSFNHTYKTFSGDSWEGTVRWSPRKSAYIEWLSGRKPGESTGIGSFVLSTSNALDFGYNLSARTRLHLNVAELTEEFSTVARIDKTPSYGLKAEYRLRSWLLGQAEYTHSAKTSRNFTGTTPDFTNDIFLLSIRTEI